MDPRHRISVDEVCVAQCVHAVFCVCTYMMELVGHCVFFGLALKMFHTYILYPNQQNCFTTPNRDVRRCVMTGSRVMAPSPCRRSDGRVKLVMSITVYDHEFR